MKAFWRMRHYSMFRRLGLTLAVIAITSVLLGSRLSQRATVKLESYQSLSNDIVVSDRDDRLRQVRVGDVA